ncbi:DUF5605 domain-containing protein [Frondihabitans australicus]|uniref:Uncharacterized protein DUF4038 n=1 Tax=Frondihabitans australicus TaxID=386892 RepID=A0A495IHP0_9MICO|nr:DUF5605 domain-containing protein [Frondihabitans australicus]RKR75289.1 uncharacterized protein DUF4038 [Frondihabitans australicus]
MTSPTSRFHAGSALFDVLRDHEAAGVLRRHAPSIVESTLLHTFHAQPLGLVLETEDSLTASDREAILRELETIKAPVAEIAGRTPPVPPSQDYEADDVAIGSARVTHDESVARWTRFEIRLAGPSHGNPFVDVELTARFFGPGDEVRDVLGFYDGDGSYVVRLLPDVEGSWRFETASNARSLSRIRGGFTVTPATSDGPVRVADKYHFAYASGRRYLPIGTTSYAWTHQPDELQDTTLRTLAESPFNKLRMCVFPKSYTFNSNEPERFPFDRRDDGAFDLEAFDVDYWRRLEHRIDQLAELGVEADLILFHAYDRWGFSTMDAASDDRYVRYAVARLGAFRNLWWSLANEFDLLFDKSEADWERWAQIIETWDAAQHPRSIHNCRIVYDQSRPWITHVSMQRTDMYKTSEMTTEWRRTWGKPVVVDEAAYEGDIDQGWGNISGEEMTRRFWEGALRGGYVGHGETYVDPDEILWWAKGGELHGESPARIGFLTRFIEESPAGVLEPLETEWDATVAGRPGEQYLYYFGFGRPRFRRFFHDPQFAWRVEVIDTWNMTVDELPGTASGRFVVDLPARAYMAVRLTRVDTGAGE